MGTIETFELGPVRQVAYVVHDIERAIRQWTEVLGVGPFFYIDRLPIREYLYRGRRSEPQLSAALSYSGNLQIELLAQHNDAPSMWRSFLDSGHEGLHHVSFWTHEFDRNLARLTDRGLEIAHTGQGGGPRGRFAYLSPGSGDANVIELSELDENKVTLFTTVAESARSWDGSDPVRQISPAGVAER